MRDYVITVNSTVDVPIIVGRKTCSGCCIKIYD